MYRDIRPGDRGDDVAELKAALRRLRFDAGESNLFDVRAQKAVTLWMRSMGYEPFGPTEVQQEQLRAATEAARKTDADLASAQGALVKGAVAPSADKILAGDEAIRSAVDRAAAARTVGERLVAQAELLVLMRRTGVVSAQAAVDRAVGDLTVELSVADADQSLAAAAQRVVDADAAVVRATRAIDTAKADAVDAAAAVVDAQAALDGATAAQTAAEADVVRVRAKPAPTIPVSNGVYTIDTESLNASIRQAEAAVTTAVAQVRSASATLRAAQRASVRAVDAIGDAEAGLVSVHVAAVQARESARIAGLRRTQSKRTGVFSGSSASATPPAAAPTVSAPTIGAPPGSVSAGDVAAGSALPVSGPISGGAATGNASSASAGASSGTPVGSSNSESNASLGGVVDPAQLQVALVTAQTELDSAIKAVEPARRGAVAAIRAADAQVVIARAQRVELTKPADTATFTSALAAARTAKASADANLARLEATVGIVVPANEVLFFPSLPLRVDESKLSAGDALSGVLMTVATQRLAVDAAVDPSDATTLRVGQAAEVEATDLGLTVAATITKIGATPGTDGADASRIYVEVTPNEDATLTTINDTTNPDSKTPAAVGNRKPTLADLNGVSVKVTVPISTTNGNVLAVPTPAVSAAADGTVRVEVETAPGRPTKFVTVKAGLRADGYVQVAPTVTGTLKQGDLVVTGTAGTSTIAGTPDAGDTPAPDATAPVNTGT